MSVLPNLRLGSKRVWDVKHLQTRLSFHGHKVSVDGVFGPRTQEAVIQFQASRNLVPDGIVGPNTWYALEAPSEQKATSSILMEERAALIRKIPKNISGRRLASLIFAAGDLGADEIPDGSNYGPEIEHLVSGYNEFWGIDDQVRRPWCVMATMSWIAFGCGLGKRSSEVDWSKHPCKKFHGSTYYLEKWARGSDIWVHPDWEAPPASLFTMARGGSGSDWSTGTKAGHTGMVVVDNGNGTVTTIEGNVSNGVRSYVRKKKGLHGFLEWWKPATEGAGIG